MIEHNLHAVMSLADKVVVLDYGRKISERGGARSRRDRGLSRERRLMALDIADFVAGYGDITVLRGISCSVPAQGVVALLGANGAGKTTTLNAISGLQVSVGSGTIRLDGSDITRVPAHERVEAGIAHVPQDRHLFSFMSVRENLELGGYAPRARGHEKDALDRIFDIFPRLKERLGQQAGSLSGGEQQMCA